MVLDNSLISNIPN